MPTRSCMQGISHPTVTSSRKLPAGPNGSWILPWTWILLFHYQGRGLQTTTQHWKVVFGSSKSRSNQQTSSTTEFLKWGQVYYNQCIIWNGLFQSRGLRHQNSPADFQKHFQHPVMPSNEEGVWENQMFPFKEKNTDEMPLFLCAFQSLSPCELSSRQGRAPGLLMAVVSKTLCATARELGKSLDWKPRGLSPKLNVALTTRNNGTAGDLWWLSSLSKKCYRTIIAEFLCFVPIKGVFKLI